MPVTSTGRPPGSASWSAEGQEPREHGDAELDPGAEHRHEQRQEREREDQVDAELGRVGNRRSEQEAAERGEVPGDEQAELDAEQERERPLAGARGDAERLVGEEEGRDRPLTAAEIELAPDRDAVEQMADVEEERRQDDARPGRPRCEQPDGGELGAAGEDERPRAPASRRARARRRGP